MADNQSINDLPDYAYLDLSKSVHLTGWESRPITVPRTLAISKVLTPVEKVVGLYAYTVLDNMSYGGEIYDWLDSEEGARVVGLPKDVYKTALFNLHDAGYLKVTGREAPTSPTQCELEERELVDLGRNFHAANYIAQQERIAQEQATQKPHNARKDISAQLRLSVYKADGYQCVACGTNEDLAVDHIVPVLHGGTNDRDNLQTLCQPCNSSKGTKTMDEWITFRNTQKETL